jgi:hypothetical protein
MAQYLSAISPFRFLAGQMSWPINSVSEWSDDFGGTMKTGGSFSANALRPGDILTLENFYGLTSTVGLQKAVKLCKTARRDDRYNTLKRSTLQEFVKPRKTRSRIMSPLL